MEIVKAKTRPWKHHYYFLIKDMYHPFLYHNHLYCELPDEEIVRLLNERDSYIRTIQSSLIRFELTEGEFNWMCYLRDCCLFELHRRKYKHVLADVIKNIHKSYPLIENWQTSRLSAHWKVRQWLNSTVRLYQTSDYLGDTDEDPEHLQENDWPEDSISEKSRSSSENYTQDTEPLKPEIKYIKAPDNKKETIKLKRQEKKITDVENPQKIHKTNLVPLKSNMNVKSMELDESAKAGKSNDTLTQPLDVIMEPEPNMDFKPMEFDESATPGESKETSKPFLEAIMWPDYPREMLEKHPELFEPRTVKSLGKMISDRDYIQRRCERKYELQLIAERREIVLMEYKRQEEENKRKEEEKIHKDKQDRIKRELEQRMEHAQLEQRMEHAQLEPPQHARRNDPVLGSDFVGYAIKTALHNSQSSQIQVPCAEQAATSQDNRIVITWDEITNVIDTMNRNIKKDMPTAKTRKMIFDSPPTESSSHSSGESTSPGHIWTRPTEMFPQNSGGGTWFRKKNDSRYISPGTYTVPKAAPTSTHIRTGELRLITVSEEEEDEDEDNEEQFHYSNIKPSSQYRNASTLTEPPPVPPFVQSEEGTESSSSQLSLVPSRKRPASCMDNNDLRIILDNVQSESNSDYTGSVVDTNPPNVSVSPPSPMSCDDIDVESTISESDIDCTLPEIEPDFMNLPLPETPDDTKNK